MAVLGAQVVFSLVTFTFLHKLAPFYSIGRWLMRGRLLRYLHPTNQELKQLDKGDPIGGKKGKQQKEYRRQAEKAETFTVKRAIPLQLDQAPVEDIDLVPLQYYWEYTWLMDFSMAAVLVYGLTEAYFLLSPHRLEFNLSLLWCLLAIASGLRVLASQAWLYLKGGAGDGGERVLLITFSFFFLVFAMAILVVGDHVIELGLDQGYVNFSANAEEFLKKQGVSSQGPMSFLTYKIVLAFTGMIIGGLLTFPGLRFAKLHLDTLKYSQGRVFVQTLVQINYFLPILVLLLWVRPLARDLLCGKHFIMARAVIFEDQFDGLRFIIILACCALRLCLMPLFLQSHLNLAHERIEKMKKETGRISNVEIQKTVARVFFYLCVVAIQYIAPVFILLFLAFLLKTTGNYSWVSLFGETAVNFFSTTPKPGMTYPNFGNGNDTMATIAASAAEISTALSELREVFTPTWYRGIFQYLLWWSTTAWFTATTFGVMYYSQAQKS